MAVPVHRNGRQQQCQQAKLQYCRRAIGNIADLLRKADDLNVEITVLELLTNLLFQDLVVGHIVQTRASGIKLVEFDGDHRAALIPRDQRADKAPLSRRIGDPGNGFIIEAFGGYRTRYKWICTEALLGYLVDESVRRPQRTHAATRNIGQKGDCLSDVIQTLESRLAPDLACASLDHDGQAIRPQQVIAVCLERFYIFMADG
ncbi:hypothetical protein D3C78_942310 [compost metagenome]